MRRSVLDTDTLSYLLRERDSNVVLVAKQYARVFHHLTVTSITIAEVVKGLALVGDMPGL